MGEVNTGGAGSLWLGDGGGAGYTLGCNAEFPDALWGLQVSDATDTVFTNPTTVDCGPPVVLTFSFTWKGSPTTATITL